MMAIIGDPCLTGTCLGLPATVRCRPGVATTFTNTLRSVPEDIVLGPPRTAFASAAGARNQSRTLDTANRPSFGAQGDETARGDRQSFRDKFTRQGPRDDVDTEGSHQARSGNQQNRRATNEHDSWSGRQSRLPGQDEGEKGSHRSGYREQNRDNNLDTKTSRGFDNHRRDGVNEANDTRRNGHGRGRNEHSWYRDDKDGEVFEGKRDTTRARDWREKNRGSARKADIDWNQNTKPEVDPEWMDEPDVAEKKHAHTQEDFERWKERMKAGNGPTQENAPPTGEQRPHHEPTFSGLTSSAGKVKVDTPLMIDPSIDGFFGQWNEPGRKKITTDDGAAQAKAEMSKAKAAKASKFTGFFGAKALPTELEPEAPVMSPFTAPADSSTEDKEGFQRILKLLDQQQTNPAKDGAAREQSSRMPASSAAQARQQQDASNLQSLLSPRSKNGGPPPQNKDSEFLLNLMRQSRQANSTVPPELLPFSNLVVTPQQTPGPPPGLPNTMPREDAQPHDKLNPTPTSDRKRPPPGLYSTQPPGVMDAQRFGKDGLEFAPSIISQHVPQRQSMMPPPGFQAPLRTSGQFPPGLMASMQSPIHERGNPYGMRMGPGNAPPGMPPPGFSNAPPPGFAPMPLNPDNANRMFFGGPPRPPVEGFGEAGGDFGLGQFRRQD